MRLKRSRRRSSHGKEVSDLGHDHHGLSLLLNPFLVAVLSRDKEILDMYAKMTAREAQGLQSALGWIVEGVQRECRHWRAKAAFPQPRFKEAVAYSRHSISTIEDLLLFRFTRIDPEDPEKEFTIVLDISTRSYRGERIVCPSLQAGVGCRGSV